MKALLLENIHPEGVRLLTERGIDVELVKGALDESELISALDGVQLLGIRSKTTVTAAVLDAAPDLMAIGAFCIGTNQIDLARASSWDRGLQLAVLQHPQRGRAGHRGDHRDGPAPDRQERPDARRRLGQVGQGRPRGTRPHPGHRRLRQHRQPAVGDRRSARHARLLLRCRGQAGPGQRPPLRNAGRTARGVETVSLHVDGRAGNAGLFGAEQFAKMRPRSLFLNLCRGIVVDHDALREHLLSGHIAGAALDVFAAEPKTAGDPFMSSLQGIPNVILTPHVGGSTEEAQQDIGRFVAGKLRDFAFGGNTAMSVNMPQVQIEVSAGRSRVLHVHHNVPGVLATVNGVLADFGVNIEGQVLSTRGALGYVITDIAGPLTPELVDKLAGLPETVRLRVLD